MKRLACTLVATAIASLLVPRAALAQNENNNPFIFGIYYRCSEAKESRADEIYEQVVAPVVQKHVDLGHLTGTLWLAHDQGGCPSSLLIRSFNRRLTPS